MLVAALGLLATHYWLAAHSTGQRVSRCGSLLRTVRPEEAWLPAINL